MPRVDSSFVASTALGQSDRSVVAGRVVGRGQAADANTGVLVLRVDELVVPDIDADMRQPPGVGVLEEDQITRLEIAVGDRRACYHLRPEAAADVIPQDVKGDPVGETGAVERVRSRG